VDLTAIHKGGSFGGGAFCSLGQSTDRSFCVYTQLFQIRYWWSIGPRLSDFGHGGYGDNPILDMALISRYAVLAYAWTVIGICWLAIVAWLIRGPGTGRERRLITAAVFACSIVALILTLRGSHLRPYSAPDPPAQKLPPGNGVQRA
jgi:hypothetical protein